MVQKLLLTTMAASVQLEDVANGVRVLQRPSRFCGSDWIISCFRFPTALLMELCAGLQPHLERVLLRTHSSGTLTCALNITLIRIYKANVLGFRQTQMLTLEFSGCLWDLSIY